MAVPKKRTTSSKRNMRRSHHGLKKLVVAACPQCKSPVQRHTACATCGTYKGRQVLNTTPELKK